jgi:hypothetical protein
MSYSVSTSKYDGTFVLSKQETRALGIMYRFVQCVWLAYHTSKGLELVSIPIKVNLVIVVGSLQ